MMTKFGEEKSRSEKKGTESKMEEVAATREE